MRILALGRQLGRVGCVMRYVSAERTIAAAGAAFAFSDEEAWRLAPPPRAFGSRFRALMWKALLVTGLVVV